MTTFTCDEALALMSAAVDGELSYEEQEAFDQHILWCLSCAREYQEAKKTKSIIREKITRFKAPQSLINSILRLTETPS
ncbi:anti-sigma factor [Prosthecochloris sp. HL-130-GSB]|jgi:anti-sigma factor RsiW|uniref:Anti-sigma factor n=1 Tax=Prosthecochloris aestuarii TaxID=1102 RepID=A0A831WPQ2_PROAE|nr:zf-HC2 domain-containing protein [Prosthecochloris sp. HL-130-GSB]ARM31190.1 anti-sigma factor [Prosthecochloris sp. HL-130-GSB]MBO8092535.1 zf-HC2 domain-containing protein [Prosthecochloris sp.]HED31763.1 anti-sigma factor [Prosthecochloris aestuarii]